jgi:6-phosphogluconolactonase (cycloisomerase 2 family)
MRLSRNVILGTGLAAAITGLGVGQAALDSQASPQTVEAPRFEVDPLWPKPLPNGWLLGQVIGVGVDSRDHVYIVHRANINPATEGAAEGNLADCCRNAPPVLEFDPQGNLVKGWGGPVDGAPYVWPASNHGIDVDSQDNVWIGGNGGADGGNDSHVLKFTRDGRYLMTIGEPNSVGADSNSRTRYGRVAKIQFDEAANEAYFADGYQNKRVAVVDMTTGALKRFWGAYGNVPNDTLTLTDGRGQPGWSADQHKVQQFRNPVHCADISNDGFVYVCDRQNNRIQVFQKNGTFVKEAFYAPKTLGDGATWDVAFSRDAAQKFMYIADGKNMRMYIVDRQSLQLLTSFGTGGRQPGQWHAVHSVASDSQGNLYTTETYEGRRVQKFVYRGLGPVTRLHQGVVWPTGGN